MANTKSAKKMGRAIVRKTDINRRRRSQIKTLVRFTVEAIEEEDGARAALAFQKVQPHIQRGIAKGIFHRKTAARRISRLAKQVASLNQQTPQNPST